MPILPSEPTVYPHDLLTEMGRDTSARQWWVLYTKSRQEKAVTRALAARQIPHYLPLVARQSIIRGRRVSSFVPVFPSYVFVFGNSEEREQSLKTNRICQVLTVMDNLGLCSDLGRVQTMIESGCPLTIEARLMPGQRVRVRKGPLIGIEGMVIRRKQQTRLVVDVRMLQQGVSVEIDDFLLEPLELPGKIHLPRRRGDLLSVAS
jgi:transcriptional antiterminator RfaH